MSRGQDRSIPSAADYLNCLGVVCEEVDEGSILIPCPVHAGDDDAPRTMKVWLKDGRFGCSTCGARGVSVITLHQLLTGMNRADAARDLQRGEASWNRA